MKTVAIIFMLCCFASPKAKAYNRIFDTEDARVQAYIVKQLSLALKDSDIVILQDRIDEVHRGDEYAGFSYGQQTSLGLRTVRFIGGLKGAINVGRNERIYLYKPDYSKWDADDETVNPPPPYDPSSSLDDLTNLTFIKRTCEPIKDRVVFKKLFSECKAFTEDAVKMKGSDFIEKYKLADVFSNQVYEVVEGCIFNIDFPSPVMTNTKSMRIEKQMDKRDPEFVKKHFFKIQEYSKQSLIHFSSREVSEIVFIAYLLEGDKGVGHYAAARKDIALLEPMEEMTFKTNIGKKLFEALKAEIRMPPKGNSTTNPPSTKKP
jgi:hypothetical protein